MARAEVGRIAAAPLAWLALPCNCGCLLSLHQYQNHSASTFQVLLG